MIISHTKKMVFLHNPKAAGTSVRYALDVLHDEPQSFWEVLNSQDKKSEDIAHLGIDEIAALYPALWNRIKDYEFFSLRRNIGARFISSLSEYSKNFADIKIKYSNADQRKKYLFQMIEELERFKFAENLMGQGRVWAHFKPQWIFWHSEKYSPKIQSFDLVDIESFLGAIEAKTSIEILMHDNNRQSSPKNYPSFLKLVLENRILRKSAFHVSKLLGVRDLLNQKLSKQADYVYGVTQAEYEQVEAFVRKFYARDFEMWPIEMGENFNLGKSFKIIN